MGKHKVLFAVLFWKESFIEEWSEKKYWWYIYDSYFLFPLFSFCPWNEIFFLCQVGKY